MMIAIIIHKHRLKVAFFQKALDVINVTRQPYCKSGLLSVSETGIYNKRGYLRQSSSEYRTYAFVKMYLKIVLIMLVFIIPYQIFPLL